MSTGYSRWAGQAILTLAVITSLGCADDEPFVGPESSTLTGTWNFGVTIFLETGDCAGNNEPPWNAEIEIVQDVDNSVTATGDWHSDPGTGPHTFAGTFDPDALTLVLDGHYPEAGGTLLALYQLDVNPNYNRMEGTESWTWTSDMELCHDSQSTVVANRVNE